MRARRAPAWCFQGLNKTGVGISLTAQGCRIAFSMIARSQLGRGTARPGTAAPSPAGPLLYNEGCPDSLPEWNARPAMHHIALETQDEAVRQFFLTLPTDDRGSVVEING